MQDLATKDVELASTKSQLDTLTEAVKKAEEESGALRKKNNVSFNLFFINCSFMSS